MYLLLMIQSPRGETAALELAQPEERLKWNSEPDSDIRLADPECVALLQKASDAVSGHHR